jgi:hypothetical protein
MFCLSMIFGQVRYRNTISLNSFLSLKTRISPCSTMWWSSPRNAVSQGQCLPCLCHTYGGQDLKYRLKEMAHSRNTYWCYGKRSVCIAVLSRLDYDMWARGRDVISLPTLDRETIPNLKHEIENWGTFPRLVVVTVASSISSCPGDRWRPWGVTVGIKDNPSSAWVVAFISLPPDASYLVRRLMGAVAAASRLKETVFRYLTCPKIGSPGLKSPNQSRLKARD